MRHDLGLFSRYQDRYQGHGIGQISQPGWGIVRPGYLATHGVGFHPDPSRCFLNSYVLT